MRCGRANQIVVSSGPSAHLINPVDSQAAAASTGVLRTPRGLLLQDTMHDMPLFPFTAYKSCLQSRGVMVELGM